MNLDRTYVSQSLPNLDSIVSNLIEIRVLEYKPRIPAVSMYPRVRVLLHAAVTLYPDFTKFQPSYSAQGEYVTRKSAVAPL